MTSLYRATYHLRSHKRDELIEFIKSMLLTPFVLHTSPAPITDVDRKQAQILSRVASQNTLATSPLSNGDNVTDNAQRIAEILGDIEELINEHIEMTRIGLERFSRLHRLVPTLGNFYTPLPLREAFLSSGNRYGIAGRLYVPPSFNDIRRILNTAQIMAGARDLKLITFDGDMTLYDDGENFTEDSVLTDLLVRLLKKGIHVAVVTAAGYGENTTKYEARLSGLLKGFKNAGLSAEQVSRFFVLGGECNYLLRCTPEYCLRYMEDSEYTSSSLRSWPEGKIRGMLDVAQRNLEERLAAMRLDATILRKSRAVGVIPKAKMTREQLDEFALSTQMELLKYQRAESLSPTDAPVPFCAFNGGNDVWVDIGNKFIGVQILQEFLSAKPSETFHVGDQFLLTGNDIATRRACCTCWIINPDETRDLLQQLDEQLGKDGRV